MIPPADAPTRPALRYHGGKHRLASWIISFFPPHLNYVEPCGGSASVLLQKPKSPSETYNDLDSNVVNFFRVLRDRPDELISKIRLTPRARAEFYQARECLYHSDPVEWARRLFILSHQSFGGIEKWPGWSLSGNDNWANIEELDWFASRLLQVRIEQDDALEVIKRYDDTGTLFYFDPPYQDETRERPNRYLTDSQGDNLHIESAGLLRSAQGFVIVSGYACPLYTELYEAHGWQRFDKEAQTNSGGKRIESLWLSPRTLAALGKPMQAKMFELEVLPDENLHP